MVQIEDSSGMLKFQDDEVLSAERRREKDMKEKVSKVSSIALIALLALGMLGVFSVLPVNASPTNLEVIADEGLWPGTHDSNFTAEIKSVGDTFIVNITVVDVTDLQNWQIKLTWDETLLDYVDISLPSDHVFSMIDPPRTMINPPKSSGPGYITWGCTYINTPEDYWTFNGTGTLCQIELEITKGVSAGGPMEVHCDLTLADIGVDTFLLDHAAHDISFSAVDGRYFYWWVAPTYYPTLYIKPATYTAAATGELVELEVWVKDVSSAWEIIGFQFSLMWNVTFLTPDPGPKGAYYDNGTFLEGFEYYPDGVLYVAKTNLHERPPPLTPMPEGWNFSTFGCMLMPDPATGYTYHEPYPSVGSDGALLMKVYFKATDHYTISPVEDWTWIKFIDFCYSTGEREDTYAMDKYIHILPVDMVNCHYRAPQVILGLSIDLYTQYDPPYGGQGANMPSDMFQPQQAVILCALVTYNEYPVQQKLVGFEIRHGDYMFWREAPTDEYGIACVTFRLPWPCIDPEDEIFGKWIVISTVEVAKEVENDTLGFWVWWSVFVDSVEPKQTEFIQRKTGGDDLLFTVVYCTYSMQVLPVTVTVTVYDELGFFIGSGSLITTVGWGEYFYYDYLICEEPPLKCYTWDVTIPMPTNAVVGKGIVYANAFDKFPWLGGTPYCPEVTNTIDFYIKKP